MNTIIPSQTPLADTQRWVDVEDGLRVWTRNVGGGGPQERAPLLVLHGGPGAPHDYLENLQVLASQKQRVIFYDQLGCGRSDQPDEPERWQLPRFVTEIDAVRRTLGLDCVVLLGQSWGAMLAIEYALTQPSGLTGLILSNGTASAPLWSAEAQRLREQLPEDVQIILAQHETAGTTDSAAYHEAMGVFYARHLLRIPMPDFVQRSFDGVGQPYATMWGPSEFHMIGNLKNWDRSARLHEIRVPTLIVSGEHDESTPVINHALQLGISGSRWVMLEGCSHLTHVEAPERYQREVQDFLESL